MTRAMFVGAGVGLLGRSGVGDCGVVSWLLSSSVDNSWITGGEVEGTFTEGCFVSVPRWFLCLQPRLSAACSIG